MRMREKRSEGLTDNRPIPPADPSPLLSIQYLKNVTKDTREKIENAKGAVILRADGKKNPVCHSLEAIGDTTAITAYYGPLTAAESRHNDTLQTIRHPNENRLENRAQTCGQSFVIQKSRTKFFKSLPPFIFEWPFQIFFGGGGGLKFI